MRLVRRLGVVFAAAMLFVATMAIPASAGPAGEFISLINSSRASAGLPALQSHWDLADNARYHSAVMADRQELFHSGNLGSVTTGWEKLGENVGVNFDAAGMHQAFMNSSGHRANILGDYNYVGVGVTVDDDGVMWATIIFMKAPPGHHDGGGTTTTAAPPATTTTTSPSMPPADDTSPSTTVPAPKTSTGVKTSTASSGDVSDVSDSGAAYPGGLGDPTPCAYAI